MDLEVSMKKKKITGKQIKLIINLISIAIFAFSYFYVYTGYITKTEAANQEIDRVQKSMDNREKEISEEDTVLPILEDTNTQINDIIGGYPVKIAKEDNFMFIEEMEKALYISFSSIAVNDSTEVHQTILPIRNEDGTEVIQAVTNTNDEVPVAQAEGVTDKDNNAATTDNLEESILSEDTATEGVAQVTEVPEVAKVETMTGMQTIVSMNFSTTYNNFKKLVEYIKNYPDKTVIDSASVSYDSSTGNLTGSLVIKRFSLTGTGKVYVEPYIDDINIGTDNIFGTNPEPTDIIEPTETTP